MKVYQVYNQQRSLFSGESVVIDNTMRLLEMNGHVPVLVMKSSRGIEKSLIRKIGAFWGGIYNIVSYYEMASLLRRDRPDVVHVHSVFPMFSPSILVACRRAEIPVVMTVHNHILTCPNSDHLYEGKICEECVGGHEYRCVLKNCRRNVLESLAYALRSSFARRLRLFHDNVTLFIALTNFGKSKLLQANFREEQITVVSHATSVSKVTADTVDGEYIAFAGRISPEKGIDTLLSAAEQIGQIQVRLAGGGPLLSRMKDRAPCNTQFVGILSQDRLFDFYRKSRFAVVPSVWYEPFGMVIVDAMALGLPVVASRIGGLPEIVENGVTGLLFEPGNAEDLANKLRFLWENPELCRQMGKAAQEKVVHHYSQNAYYKNLMEVYEKAITLSGK
jgi:glycosyltransferase involved in cell wall biosynthesis